MADNQIPLKDIADTGNGDDENDVFENKHYLRKFVKANTSFDIKLWKGDEADYAELDDVLEHFSMDKLKKLLLGGAPYLYKKDENNYAITHTAFYSRTDIMEIILERHKNESTPENEDEFRHQTVYALYTVCQTNCGDIARQLLQVNTPVIPRAHLNEAASTGSTAVLDEILSFFPDTDVNVADGKGNTPLHNAVNKKHTHTVQYLLNNNANPNLTNGEGYNCVHMACQCADEDILYLLTTRNADVNAREKRGKSPAMIAAENGKDGCIHILASAGANLDQRDKLGNAPLITAAGQGHTNTVRELILNGASFDVTDNDRYNALEKAILDKKDGAAAMFIRLAPQEDYVSYYLATVEISMLKIVRYNLTETLKALMDRMVVQTDPLNSTRGEIQTRYLDVDTEGKMPDSTDYEKNKRYLLERIAGLDDEDLAYHGTMRILVDQKMKEFGNRVLGLKIVTYVLFLLALAFSLIVLASYTPIELEEYLNGWINYVRIVTELFVLFYFLFNLVTEGVEFFRVTRLTYRYIQDKKKGKEKEEKRADTLEHYQEIDSDNNDDDDDVPEDDKELTENKKDKKEKNNRSITSRLNDLFFVRIFTDYFSDKSNYLDVLGLLTLFILIILRVTAQPTQWVFATVTFLINGLRLFKLVALLPRIGPYTNTIYKILTKDVPLFFSLFLITLLIFTGGFFISLRTPYTQVGFTNATLMQDTERVSGVDNEVSWVFLSGLRVLLEGNVYDPGYLYRQLNWLAGAIYLGFLFLTIVVYLNVFIAQLSDTYGSVRQNAEKTYAWQRLNFIVQVQRTSLLSICIDYRKKYFTEKITVDKDQLFKYYGVTSIKNLNIKSSTEGVDVKEMLVSIKKQQVVSHKTTEISRLNEGKKYGLQTPPQQQQESEEIRQLSSRMDQRIDQLLEEIRQKDALLEERLAKSNQALLEMIEEKLQNLK